LHLGQRLVSDVDSTQIVGEAGQLEQGSDGHRIP
jgi:hypothetical protein